MASTIRMMGSGPRTHPGGISDREWRSNQRRQIRSIQKEYRNQLRIEAAQRRASLQSLIQRLKEEAEEENIESPQRFNGEHYRTLDGRISHRFLPQNASFSTRLYCKIGLEFDPSHLLDDEQK